MKRNIIDWLSVASATTGAMTLALGVMKLGGLW